VCVCVSQKSYKFAPLIKYHAQITFFWTYSPGQYTTTTVYM